MLGPSTPISYAIRLLCSLATAAALVLVPHGYGVTAWGQSGPDLSDQSRRRGVDPCEFLPELPDQATGSTRCPVEGSSSGVARGDFNGDGLADLAVGVPQEDIGSITDAGAVHVIYGSADGLAEAGATACVPAPQFWHQDVSDPVLGGVRDIAEASDRFGAALAAGNFNGDSFSDLAIGAPGEDIAGFTGVVHVLFGSANGLTASSAVIDDQIWKFSDFFVDIAPTDTEFGASLAWGDFNGDAVGDLAVGIPGAGVICGIFCEPRNVGRVLVMYGFSPGGLRTFGFQAVFQSGRGGFGVQVGDWIEENDRFGQTLAAGDFDDNGFDDLVIGVPKEDRELTIVDPVEVDAGIIHVAFGSGNGLIDEEFPLIRNPGQFGRALAVGDFNGDGIADLAAGSPFEDVGDRVDAGRVYVIDGSEAGLDLITNWDQGSPGIQDGPASGDHFGIALAAGDFNADGVSDLAVGVPDEDFEVDGALRTNAGAVHIIYGTGSGLDEAGDQFFHQGNLGAGRTLDSDDRFGASLTAWNFGRNEVRFVQVPGFPVPVPQTFRTADLAIGVPGQDVGVRDAGALSVLYGHSINRLSANGNQLWTQTTGSATPTSEEAGDRAEQGDRFGTAVY